MDKKMKLDQASKPQDIENRSFAIIDAEIKNPPYQGKLWQVARRMIHTTGDTNLVHDIVLNEDSVNSGINALRQGCTIFTDTEMARCGMVARRLEPLGVKTQCILNMQGVQEFATAHACTRSRAGILQIANSLAGNIVAIGNAPTALLALLEVLKQGATPPALIVGMPVGFVNAAESKELLMQSEYSYLTLKGRKGGSPVVASVINALAILAAEVR